MISSGNVNIYYRKCQFSVVLALFQVLLRGKEPESWTREGPRAADIYLIWSADSALYEQNSGPGWNFVTETELLVKSSLFML